jgi:hypothetical protein
MGAPYDRDDLRPDPAGIGLQNIVFDQNTRANLLAQACKVSDPVFFPYDPLTGADLTDFLRNPMRGGKPGGRVRLVYRQYKATFDASNPTQILSQRVDLAGGDNLVMLACLADANDGSSTRYDLYKFDLDIKDGQTFTIRPQAPLNLYASADAGLPAKLLPEQWRGANARYISVYNRTGIVPGSGGGAPTAITVYLNFYCAQVDTME